MANLNAHMPQIGRLVSRLLSLVSRFSFFLSFVYFLDMQTIDLTIFLFFFLTAVLYDLYAVLYDLY